jgi:hypothetical protein
MRSIGIALASLLLLPQVAMARGHRGEREERGGRVVVGAPGVRGRVVVGPRGGVVVRGPRVGVRIGVAPPRPRYEVRTRAPSPRHVWRAGYWGWRNGAHYWVAGNWILPPATGEVWVPAAWVNVNGAWEFHDGYWDNAEVAQPVVEEPPQPMVEAPPPVEVEPAGVEVEAPPPAPMAETAPPPPQPGWQWTPGHWQWHGHRYRWIPGHYQQPREGYVWMPGRWVPAGNHWRFQRGHWVAR